MDTIIDFVFGISGDKRTLGTIIDFLFFISGDEPEGEGELEELDETEEYNMVPLLLDAGETERLLCLDGGEGEEPLLCRLDGGDTDLLLLCLSKGEAERLREEEAPVEVAAAGVFVLSTSSRAGRAPITAFTSRSGRSERPGRRERERERERRGEERKKDNKSIPSAKQCLFQYFLSNNA